MRTFEQGGTHSTASLTAHARMGTRWNASLPDSEVQCANLSDGFSPREWPPGVPLAWKGFSPAIPAAPAAYGFQIMSATVRAAGMNGSTCSV
jgi:hypothetical protein